MNHRKKNNHLSRKYGHRKSILSNMSSSLIKNKKIFTTLAKAKALKKYVEPIITKSKINTTHSKRNIFSLLRDKIAVSELFNESFKKVRERPGGYTRIIKIGFRSGDMAKVSLIELVDFNNIYNSKKNLKLVRRSGKKKRVNPIE
ncbi:50S ribosomal protein L17 [Blattabacterium punctulatus]|uniref:Large ribosomal subunit protein bL17 n=2 Tax=Blattabacterium punctulatus TaxID=164514 RepID=A0ABN5M1X0_9FLAO|nr:50S ribosomal protein L17 [Blattabacterium punctulatus]AWU39814.1 50S ribosomal protein L17 [Blattabacterium punctulatus]AWU40358.1 50S ribosomal protein L17 [Blattabacterium punctulatus]AWU42613.1 50S ribosomal protein L17 [Blattabacterium punctulatus]AWU43157.1 50S ribosomal protein L17 [Blattabacterium punctulatus]